MTVPCPLNIFSGPLSVASTNERIYMVLRMMGVLKRASKRTWQDIEEALYLFLTMPKDTTDLIKHVQAWDPGKLRKDVMAFSEHEFVAI
jgi:hypothetical protein